MRELLRLDGVSRPALGLVIGRAIGFLAAFFVPLVLVRLFDPAAFGTYKQLFLIYGTLYGVAQLGVAESLYYFIPRNPSDAGRHATNAVVTLAVVGLGCMALLGAAAGDIARWLSNPQLADTLVLLGAFLALMLISALFEIVLVSRQQYKTAAYAYAASDVLRTALILMPAIAFGGLRAVLWGAIAFATLRVIAMLWTLGRDLGTTLRPSLDAVAASVDLHAALRPRRSAWRWCRRTCTTTWWPLDSTRRRSRSTRSGASKSPSWTS